MSHAKNIIEGASAVIATSTLVGWLMNILPSLAALFSILWISFQFYFSQPMVEWRGRRRNRRRDDHRDIDQPKSADIPAVIKSVIVEGENEI